MRVFLTGATGYLGRALGAALVIRGHTVRGLVRPGSEERLPAGVLAVPGNPLDARTFDGALGADDTVVHLVGTPHPGPGKSAAFEAVDWVSIRETVTACCRARVAHLVYVSVAHPAPVMRDYIAVRQRGEALIADAGLSATILRPWYVLGPGHRWPHLLRPVYVLASLVPALGPSAERLGLVTLAEMTNALVQAVESGPPGSARHIEVPAIRRARIDHPLPPLPSPPRAGRP